MILPWWLSALAGAISAGVLAIMLHTIDVNRIEAKAAKTLAAQIQFDIEQCDTDKQLTKGANDDLQSENANLRRDLAAAKLQVGTRCIVPIAKPAGVGDRPSTPTKLSRSNEGVTSDSLLEFAANCEQTRLYLLNLREFDLLTWKAKGQ